MSLITDSPKIATNRRSFLRSSLATAAGAALLPSAFSTKAEALTTTPGVETGDLTVLNFALQLEYLEAQYYSLATSGMTLEQLGIGTSGFGTLGTPLYKSTSTIVPFESTTIKEAALEIAQDEQNHVNYLRGAISASGNTPAAQPPIDLLNSFYTLGSLAGLGDTFDPFESELTFLLGAFIFEDVGVTAYRGGSVKITDKAYLKAAAGILAVEALHAGEVRALLYAEGYQSQCQAISDVRDSVDGSGDLDQGIGDATFANIAPTDANGLCFSRNTRRVLDIVYGAKNATSGGFFPSGINTQ